MRLSIPLLSILTACQGVKLNPSTPYEVGSVPATIQLTESLTTDAEIRFPNRGKGPHPTVVLLHGAGPQDMDATIYRSDQRTTPFFDDLSVELARRGFAVVRYHKRHVRGPGDVDLPKFIGEQSTFTFKDDAAAVIDQVASHPRVDPSHVFLYGWSEGSAVAAALATERPTLAGLIVQGPVGQPYEDVFRSWFDETVPYLERFTNDAEIDGRELARALQTSASQPALMTSAMLAISHSRDAPEVRISPLVDTDKNGRIHIQDELIPKIDDLVKLAFGPIGFFVAYREGATVPPVTDQIPKLGTMPILVLQGENDAHTPPANTEAIEGALLDASHPDFEIVRIAGAGHTLGAAEHPVDDIGRPMKREALDALATWLAAHSGK